MTKTHGKSTCKIYRIWSQMRERCHNQNAHNYKYYGARGIKVCNRWHSFENFYEDMGDRPEGMSLERVDNNAGYSPDNCIWADKKTQALNTRKAKLTPKLILELRQRYKNEDIVDLAEAHGLSFTTVWNVVTNRRQIDKEYVAPLKFSSKYRGVCKWKDKEAWRASYKREYLGTFSTELEAYQVYKQRRGLDHDQKE